MLTRRQMLAGAAGLTVAGTLPSPAFAQAKAKIVIVGGGIGGASVLRRLVAEAKGALDITLIEPQSTYTTCFYSNLFIGGVQPFDILRHGFAEIVGLPGVTVAADRATAIDLASRHVLLAGGATISYDRLVLSPGIDLDYGSVPGWSKDAEERMPHAWKAGPQTELLKRQLDAVPDGGLVVVIAPPNPYRCPPGPYERVSMLAHTLKSSGRNQTHIVVLDPKESFSKQPLFQQGWEKHYPGMIEWLPPAIHGGIVSVDPAAMSVATGFETYRAAALVNVIPRQTAGHVAVEAGLTDKNGYCPIDPFTMKADGHDAIFVLGDAAVGGDMPKSAFSTHSQAQVVARKIVEEILDGADTDAAYRNRCWSLIATDDSVFVGGRYRPTAEKIEQVESEISGMADSAETRRTNYEDSGGWFVQLTTELYG